MRRLRLWVLLGTLSFYALVGSPITCVKAEEITTDTAVDESATEITTYPAVGEVATGVEIEEGMNTTAEQAGDAQDINEMVSDINQHLQEAHAIFSMEVDEENEIIVRLQDGTDALQEVQEQVTLLEQRYPEVRFINDSMNTEETSEPEIKRNEDGKFNSFNDLFQYWSQYGYPDKVGGVFYQGEKLVISIVGEDEATKNEILNSISEPVELTFQNARYSYQELLNVNDAVVADLKKGSAVIACGISEINNCVEVMIQTGAEGAKEYIEKYQSLYGDMVVIEESSGITSMDTSLDGGNGFEADQGNQQSTAKTYLQFGLIFVVVAGGCMIFLFYRMKRHSVLQTVHGETIARGNRMSKSLTEKKITESVMIPKDDSLNRILEAMDK